MRGAWSTGERRALPSVDSLLRHDAYKELIADFGRQCVVDGLRDILAERRASITELGAGAPSQEEIFAQCAARLRALMQPSLRPVFNLTGTVLHTNLGRALLPEVAIAAAAMAMAHPVNIEYDLDEAGRGERDSHVESWLIRMTGAEAAAVVNNNAAAVYLVLNSLAMRKEVIVSRGELVEIGGAFRIPDIMARAGCKLREVGTTNRTHASDYAGVIGDRTAAIMKVHSSNFAIQGFTASVRADELAPLARQRGVLLFNDLGCGSLLNLENWNLPHEPTAREAIADGADIVTFSGDKLLGGPQCGLIVGRKELIEKIQKNPMKRALRLDKGRLAALEAVLRLYAHPERLAERLPTLRLLTRVATDIRIQAERVLPAIASATALCAQARVVDCMSQIGSGALPLEQLPSAGIAMSPAAKGKNRRAVEWLAAAFRALPIPVIGHVKDGSLVLDLRCLDDETMFVNQLNELAPLLPSP